MLSVYVGVSHIVLSAVSKYSLSNEVWINTKSDCTTLKPTYHAGLCDAEMIIPRSYCGTSW